MNGTSFKVRGECTEDILYSEDAEEAVVNFVPKNVGGTGIGACQFNFDSQGAVLARAHLTSEHLSAIQQSCSDGVEEEQDELLTIFTSVPNGNHQDVNLGPEEETSVVFSSKHREHATTPTLITTNTTTTNHPEVLALDSVLSQEFEGDSWSTGSLDSSDTSYSVVSSVASRDDHPTVLREDNWESTREPTSPDRYYYEYTDNETEELELDQQTFRVLTEGSALSVVTVPATNSTEAYEQFVIPDVLVPIPELAQPDVDLDIVATVVAAEKEDPIDPPTHSSTTLLHTTPLAKPKLNFCVDEVDDELDLPLTKLENVTNHQRSLIPPELLRPPPSRRKLVLSKHTSKLQVKMVESAVAANTKSKRRGLFKRRASGVKKNEDEKDSRPLVNSSSQPSDRPNRQPQPRQQRQAAPVKAEQPTTRGRGRQQNDESDISLSEMSIDTTATPVKSNKAERPPRGPNIVARIRSASRSRSRSRSRKIKEDDEHEMKPILVAVTSCRSDAYYNQKAPGSTSKLPRKAPSNLKTFHELAVAVKDAYQAGGEMPTRPENPENVENQKKTNEAELDGRMVLWEFMGNLDFLLALVDEVAIDTATRGALKDDTTFKSLRDVIKKCNKVLEGMLVRRERKYTLFIRLVQPLDTKQISAMKSWNAKVERAVGEVAEDGPDAASESESDTVSTVSASTNASSASGRSGMFSRGRQLLPTAGRVRARRATPTPALRKKRGLTANAPQPDAVAAEDGYSTAISAPITQGNLAMLQRTLASNEPEGKNNSKMGMPPTTVAETKPKQQLVPVKTIQPKDELVDVIRGLRMQKMNRTKEGGTTESDLSNLKPNWRPKADIPAPVPKLPTEYIHRHRLMKQVVNCLIERGETNGKDAGKGAPNKSFITSITSRHGDKPGNGKTTLAAASIQTVEVRERFKDGIAWIQLGRVPLTEKDVRRLYEELHRQLFAKDEDMEDDESDNSSKASKENSKTERMGSRGSSFESLDKFDDGDGNTMRYNLFSQIAQSRQRFEGGDLEGIKEEFGKKLAGKKVLICLDDVWRVEDAKWFIFENKDTEASGRRTRVSASEDPFPFRVLLTSRTPGLLGAGTVQEVFVRIFSEAEAVKLLLSSTGRRPYGGKNSTVFNQARVIVKGCGNSPLAVRLASGMLRRSNRNWNLNSPTWMMLMNQCKLNLEEASRLRSFINSAGRVVDLSFTTIEDYATRAALRRCFVTFAMAFRENDWVLLGRGIPQAVVLKLFKTVISAGRDTSDITPEAILEMLQTMHLLETARHGCHGLSARKSRKDNEDISAHASESDDGPVSVDDVDDTYQSDGIDLPAFIHETPSFVMQDSIKAIAEEMAKRVTLNFVPTPDRYTSFAREIEAEQKSTASGRLWTAPLRFLAQSLSSAKISQGMDENQVHELVVASLVGIDRNLTQEHIADAFETSKDITLSLTGGAKMEEYMGAFLPTHLIRSKSFSSAGELLVDPHFISRRVAALGAVEATRRHVADLLALRREHSKTPKTREATSTPVKQPVSDGLSGAPISPPNELPDSPSMDTLQEAEENHNQMDIDVNSILRDGSRRIIDEIYRVVNMSATTSDSLTMAICLSSVGEGLLKCRQPRDAMLRLEEAVGIYRGLLGPYHIEVARALHSVAKALVKLGETRVAIQKFTEAARIYQACNASLHFDSIANIQNMASLYVDLDEWSLAASKFEDVVSMKKSVYGEVSVPVAKAINSYAILLAKHGRMNEALAHYESAKATYIAVPPAVVRDPEFELKCRYDVTLINLNIASIKSKRGDLQGAINSYEEGVRGLQEHEEALELLGSQDLDISKSSSHNKHLVAALGRIGSLKLKLGDTEGALEMYTILLKEVDNTSPTASRTEKAKAHIKIATIYRQQVGKDAHLQSIAHLRESFAMYTSLFGPDHKDTQAISSSLQQWLSEEQQH